MHKDAKIYPSASFMTYLNFALADVTLDWLSIHDLMLHTGNFRRWYLLKWLDGSLSSYISMIKDCFIPVESLSTSILDISTMSILTTTVCGKKRSIKAYGYCTIITEQMAVGALLEAIGILSTYIIVSHPSMRSITRLQ